jgi:hypothetical protein
VDYRENRLIFRYTYAIDSNTGDEIKVVTLDEMMKIAYTTHSPKAKAFRKWVSSLVYAVQINPSAPLLTQQQHVYETSNDVTPDGVDAKPFSRSDYPAWMTSSNIFYSVSIGRVSDLVEFWPALASFDCNATVYKYGHGRPTRIYDHRTNFRKHMSRTLDPRPGFARPVTLSEAERKSIEDRVRAIFDENLPESPPLIRVQGDTEIVVLTESENERFEREVNREIDFVEAERAEAAKGAEALIERLRAEHALRESSLREEVANIRADASNALNAAVRETSALREQWQAERMGHRRVSTELAILKKLATKRAVRMMEEFCPAETT